MTPRYASLRLICSPYGTTPQPLVRVIASALPARRGHPARWAKGFCSPGSLFLPGFVTWTYRGLPSSLVCLPAAMLPFSDPGRPSAPRLLSALRCCPQCYNAEGVIIDTYRGSIAALHRPLFTLHDMRCPMPCKTRFRLTDYVFAGWESNPLAHFDGFPATSFAFPPSRAFLAQCNSYSYFPE